MSDIEELKNKFLVDTEKYDRARLEDQLKVILHYCVVDRKGRVIFQRPNLINTDKVLLALISRYLAHQLDDSIPSEVSYKEISEFLNISPPQARARISDVMKSNFVKRVKSGKYIIIPYKIDSFLEYLVKRYRNG